MKTKRLFLGILSIVMGVSMIPISVKASSLTTSELISSKVEKTGMLLDTSNSEIGVMFFVENSLFRRDYQNISRKGSGYFYLKSSGDILGRFSCTGYFAYDGDMAIATDVTTDVWEVEDGWVVKKDSSTSVVSPTYACATGVFELYDSDNSLQSSATINVFCNQNGDTSVEFNGD
jgi:hypothetical protein